MLFTRNQLSFVRGLTDTDVWYDVRISWMKYYAVYIKGTVFMTHVFVESEINKRYDGNFKVKISAIQNMTLLIIVMCVLKRKHVLVQLIQ